VQDKLLLVCLRVEVTEIAATPRKKRSIESIDTSRRMRLSSARGERGAGVPAASQRPGERQLECAAQGARMRGRSAQPAQLLHLLFSFSFCFFLLQFV
jgi:hypothetical protein